MAYSNEVKEKVLEALQQGKTANIINKETGVSLATINKWKKEAGLTKTRNKRNSEKQQYEEVQEVEIKEDSTEIKEEQALPEVTKGNKQEIRQRIIDKWQQIKINGSDEEKVAVLKEWVELEPKHVMLKKQLISYLIKLGREKEAQQYESDLDISQEIQKKRTLEKWQQVKTNGRNEERVVVLKELLVLEPKNITYINDIVTCFIKQGQIEMAEEYQRRAEEINPNDTYVLGNKIKICCKKDEFEEAERVCKDAIQQYKKGSFFVKQFADILYMQGKYKEAEEVLLQYYDRFVGNYEITRDLKLVDIYVNKKEYEKAKELLEQASRKDEEGKYTSKVNCDLAWLEIKRGNFSKAKEILEKHGLKDYRVKVQYVKLLLTTGEYDKAREIIGSIDDKNKATVLLARLEALQGNGKKAMDLIEGFDYETMFIQKILLTKATIKLAQKNPLFRKQMELIYQMAVDGNDMLLIQLIQREYDKAEELQSGIGFEFDDIDLSIPDVELSDAFVERETEKTEEQQDIEKPKEGVVENEVSLNKVIAQSKTLEQNGKLKEARKLIEGQLQIMPENEKLLKRMYQIATRQGKWEEAKKYAHRRLKVNPNSLGTLKFLCFHARTDLEKRKYRKMAKDIIGRQDIKLRKKDIEIFGLENDVKIIPKEVTTTLYVKPSKVQKDSISLYRAQIKQGNTTSEEAEQMLRELENDYSIRATALKAEIYLRVFSQPKRS